MVDVYLATQSLEAAERRPRSSSLVKITKEGTQKSDVSALSTVCNSELIGCVDDQERRNRRREFLRRSILRQNNGNGKVSDVVICSK